MASRAVRSVDVDDRDLRLAKNPLDERPAGRTESGFGDDGRFDEGDCTDDRVVTVGEQPGEMLARRLFEQDRHDRRCVDDQRHVGSPSLS